MGKILIRGLKIYGYHGVNPEEKQLGQNFVFDLTLWTDLKRAGETDRISDTVSYAAVRKTVHRVVTENRFNLLEKLGTAICDAVLLEYPTIEKIKVLVQKPEAPISAAFDDVAVEIKEKR